MRYRPMLHSSKSGNIQSMRSLLLFLILTVSVVAVLSVPDNGLSKNVGGTRLVVIDPSHGGNDPGVKLTDQTREKDITLYIAQILKTGLENTGRVKVLLTRSSDTDVSITERVRTAANNRADLFVSIHVNAGFEGNASGFELYFPGFRTQPGTGETSGEIVRDMVRTQYLNESIRFSQLLQRNMERVFPRMDRGIRDLPIRIIQDLTIPAVVIEAGFATNPKERKALMEPSTQQAIGEAIQKSILEYF